MMHTFEQLTVESIVRTSRDNKNHLHEQEKQFVSLDFSVAFTDTGRTRNVLTVLVNICLEENVVRYKVDFSSTEFQLTSNRSMFQFTAHPHVFNVLQQGLLVNRIRPVLRSTRLI